MRISGVCVGVSGRLSETVVVQCHDATMMLSVRIGAEEPLAASAKKVDALPFPLHSLCVCTALRVCISIRCAASRVAVDPSACIARRRLR